MKLKEVNLLKDSENGEYSGGAKFTFDGLTAYVNVHSKEITDIKEIKIEGNINPTTFGIIYDAVMSYDFNPKEEVEEEKKKYFYPPTGDAVDSWHTEKWATKNDVLSNILDYNECYYLVEKDGKKYCIKREMADAS